MKTSFSSAQKNDSQTPGWSTDPLGQPRSAPQLLAAPPGLHHRQPTENWKSKATLLNIPNLLQQIILWLLLSLVLLLLRPFTIQLLIKDLNPKIQHNFKLSEQCNNALLGQVWLTCSFTCSSCCGRLPPSSPPASSSGAGGGSSSLVTTLKRLRIGPLSSPENTLKNYITSKQCSSNSHL